MKKIKLLIGVYISKFNLKILKWSGYQLPKKGINKDWKPGYVRYFNVLWYPKEGWINIFHNCTSQEEINQMLADMFIHEQYGPPLKKRGEQQAVYKGKKRT